MGNPADNGGYTPLHEAAGAQYGHRHKSVEAKMRYITLHVEICRLIMENVQDKNPAANNSGRTPLHSAASSGHLEICRFIIDNAQDKNPADNDGETPLHWA